MASNFNIIDDTPDEPLPDAVESDRLNSARIHAIAMDRRAAHRRRFWARAIVVIFASGAAMTAVDAFRVSGSKRIWFAIASLVFVALAIRAAFRLGRFTIDEPVAPLPTPDASAFDALSDGRQYAKGLDQLTRDRE